MLFLAGCEQFKMAYSLEALVGQLTIASGVSANTRTRESSPVGRVLDYFH